MKNIGKKAIVALVGVLVVGMYYYVSLPAVSIHSEGLWWFVIVLFAAAGAVVWCVKGAKKGGWLAFFSRDRYFPDAKEVRVTRVLWIIAIILFVIFMIGSILSSPIINAKKYRKLLNVQERDFTADIKEADFNTIPLLDKASATILGDRKMGSMVEMVSQFEVGDDYTQINYQEKPVRVTPLVYASPIKWLTNQKDGIPAYIRIDMATQNTECVKLPEGQGIKYSKSEHFNRNIYRHLRFKYPTYIFTEQIFFEIGEDDVPYWVCPVVKYNIGLFGGKTIGKVVVCNAVTGDCDEYEVGNVPQWVDKVYQAELLMGLYDYYGTLQHGYFNSILSQKDCLQTTNGYNYVAMDDDVWVYSGVTSVSGDQSNVGFVLMNQRTMETRFYKVEGAVEDSAMSSAEGQVQNLGYNATFPLLLNVSGEPTYFMALKDAAGLVKKYAMVNIQKYQWVAIGDTVKECKKNYTSLLEVNGISSNESADTLQAKGKITGLAPVVLEGTTHYYVYMEGVEQVLDFDMSDTGLLPIIKYQVGDTLTVSYTENDTTLSVQKIVEEE